MRQNIPLTPEMLEKMANKTHFNLTHKITTQKLIHSNKHETKPIDLSKKFADAIAITHENHFS